MTAMFTLPDGQTFKCKSTKRGLHSYGLIGRFEMLATAGPNAGQVVSYWTLISQHLTKSAATRNIWNEAASRAKDVKIILAA